MGTGQVTTGRIAAVVSDADVLIDFLRADLEVLELLATKMWEVYVPVEVLGEVEGLDAQDAEKLGLRVYEATSEELDEASGHGGPLSERDRLCLCVARNHGWACFTNDRRLGRECRAGGVTVIRSLRAIGLLHEEGLLTLEGVEAVAMALHEANPFFISEKLVRDFLDELG